MASPQSQKDSWPDACFPQASEYLAIYNFWQQRLIAGSRCILLCHDEQQALQLSDIIRRWQADVAHANPEPNWRDVEALSGERHLADEWLGVECDGLRCALDDALSANAFAAACGALRWGGVLLLYPGASTGRFSEYLIDRATQSAAVLKIAELVQDPSAPHIAALSEAESHRAHGQNVPQWQQDAFEQQAAVVERLARLPQGHRHRPFLLAARRGRGKSSALGQAAASWCASGAYVVVLSPARSNIQSLIDRFEALGGRHLKTHQWQLGEGRLQWQPMDRYLTAAQVDGRGQGDCLIIDEAAAFSFDQLKACLQHPRLAMATTLEGYEGSGRGFRLRFLQWLSQQRPKWRKLELHSPMRWSLQDELEPALDNWLLLTASETAASKPMPENFSERRGEHSSIQPQCLTPAQRKDLALVRPLVGLLQQAHHRNSPNDFQALLEADDQQFWYLACGTALGSKQEPKQEPQPEPPAEPQKGPEIDSAIAAAAVLIDEPALNADLLNAIAAGRRRLPGQLLRQSLAFYCQNEGLAGLPGARIQRIATAQEQRRHGCASQLLTTMEANARRDGLGWLGSSFPAEAGLIRFWRHNGYQLIRLGLTPDRITGLPSVMVLKPLQADLDGELAALKRQYSRRFFHALGREWQAMNPDNAIALWPDVAMESEQVGRSPDMHMLRRFVEGSGELSLWEVEIRAVLSQSPLPTEPADARVLVAAMFQNQSAESLGFTGKKALQNKLRQLLKRYYLAP